MHSEVAINPQELFLRQSDGRRFEKQMSLVEKFSRKFTRQAPGTVAIIGRAPDYVELAFQHLDATGQHIFGKDYGYKFAITNSITDNKSVPQFAIVGGFSDAPENTLNIQTWFKETGAPNLQAVPLIVPLESK